MGALGYTLQTPEEEKYLETKDELLAKITTYMACLLYTSHRKGILVSITEGTSW